MKKVAFILVILLTVISCKKEEKKSLIPENTFKSILVDLYLADGYYMMNYGKNIHHNDSVNFYREVIHNHGFNVEDFDSTLRYYSTQTKKLDKIYDDVITELNKLQQEASVLQQFEMDSSRNFYKKKQTWNLPKDGPREMIPFAIAIKDTGMYSIVIRLKLYDDDQAVNPHLTAYFWYDDKTKNGHRDYFPEIKYKKEDRFMVVTTHRRNSNKKVTMIKGYILNHDNKDLDFKKHVEVKNIIVAKD